MHRAGPSEKEQDPDEHGGDHRDRLAPDVPLPVAGRFLKEKLRPAGKRKDDGKKKQK